MLAIIRKTRYAQLWSYELDEIVVAIDLEPCHTPRRVNDAFNFLVKRSDVCVRRFSATRVNNRLEPWLMCRV